MANHFNSPTMHLNSFISLDCVYKLRWIGALVQHTAHNVRINSKCLLVLCRLAYGLWYKPSYPCIVHDFWYKLPSHKVHLSLYGLYDEFSWQPDLVFSASVSLARRQFQFVFFSLKKHLRRLGGSYLLPVSGSYRIAKKKKRRRLKRCTCLFH